jgi:CheY-like chemotaxis protein
MRQIIKKNLEALSKDFRISEVISGRKAVMEMESRPEINMLFLDLNMPDLKGREIDGMDVITYLHQQKKLEDMWVVIISANITKKAKERLERFGIRYFIPKPFDKDVFVGTITPMLAELEGEFENFMQCKE